MLQQFQVQTKTKKQLLMSRCTKDLLNLLLQEIANRVCIFFNKFFSIIKMADDVVSEHLEAKLKSILEAIVGLVKPRLKTKAQVTRLQEKLIDYHSNDELVSIIDEVIKILAQILPKVKATLEQEKPMIEEEEYLKLEQLLQSYEAKVRFHVKKQQELKLYCDELEAKNKQLQESKHQLVLSSKKALLDLKRDNETLISKLRQSKEVKSKIHMPSMEKNHHPESSEVTEGKNHYKSPLSRKLELHDLSSRSQRKHPQFDRVESELKGKLERFSNPNSMEASRSRKGSVSSVKFRDKV